MRELLYPLGVLAVSLLLIAVVVFGWDDRSTLVAAPEAVTENFARQIAARRFDLAMNQLASETRRSERPQTLAARFNGVLTGIGTVNHVEADTNWMQKSQAAVRARIKGDRATASFEVALVRENGLWRIEQISDLVR